MQQSPGEKTPLKPKDQYIHGMCLSLGPSKATSTSNVVAWVGVDIPCSHVAAPAGMVRWEPTSRSLPGLGRVDMGTGEDHCRAGGGQMDLPHFSVLPSCPAKCTACLSRTHAPPRRFLFSHQLVSDATCSHIPLLLRAEQTALSLSLHITSSKKTIHLLPCLLCVLAHHKLPPYDPNLAESTFTRFDSRSRDTTTALPPGSSASAPPFLLCASQVASV